jgi:hypothetical protein
MPLSFLSLPRELRDQIYELVLLHEELRVPGYRCSIGQELTPGLFQVSKTIHREATSLFYALNRFDFCFATAKENDSFFEQIGQDNVAYIRHISVKFPRFFFPKSGEITLDNDDVVVFENIQSRCANLSTLTMSLNAVLMAVDLEFGPLELSHFGLSELSDESKAFSEALKLVNTHFRAVPSSPKIIVELWTHGPSDLIQKEVESYGWTIKVKKDDLETIQSYICEYNDTDYDFEAMAAGFVYND